MKILIAHNAYQQAGGEDAVVVEEMALLRRHGEDVSLFEVRNDDIKGVWSKLRTAATAAYNPWARRQFAARLERDRPDIVHVHNFFPQLSPSIFYACRAAGVPCVFTLHNFRILCPTATLYFHGSVHERSLYGPCWWTIPKRVYRNSLVGTAVLAAMVELHKRIGTWRLAVDCFIALSSFAREKLIEGGLPPDRIVVKGNAIAEPARSDSSTVRHGALFVGRLSEEKGLPILLEAWKELDFPLKIVGTGPIRGAVEAQAGRNIAVAGQLSREQVHAEMRRASFLVMPSLCYEMFPIVVAEAFACNLPVIASDLGSIREINQDGVTGRNFRAGDARDLADKVRWAVSHPAEMQRFGDNARRRYEARHASEANYRELMKIYGETISRRKRRAG